MSDPHDRISAGALWRNQGREEYQMNLQSMMNRRARDLSSRTRSEIAASIAAPVLFITVVAWRFGFAHDPAVRWGFAAVVAWIVLSLVWVLRRIWPRLERPRDAVASASIDFYREELARRREHLRSLWLWYGPTLLACIVFLAAVLGRVWPVYGHMVHALPFVVLLIAWMVVGFFQRRRQVKDLEREIDELDALKRP